MNIPSKVMIAGLSYKVSRNVPRMVNGSRYLGEIDYMKTSIEMVAGMKADKEEEVFIHEAVHAMFEATDGLDEEEGKVNRIARVFYQFIKDNPKIFEGGTK